MDNGRTERAGSRDLCVAFSVCFRSFCDDCPSVSKSWLEPQKVRTMQQPVLTVLSLVGGGSPPCARVSGDPPPPPLQAVSIALAFVLTAAPRPGMALGLFAALGRSSLQQPHRRVEATDGLEGRGGGERRGPCKRRHERERVADRQRPRNISTHPGMRSTEGRSCV